MKILAADTTTKSLSVAVVVNGEILFNKTERNGYTHSQTLMPMILEALKVCELEIRDIDMFACTTGPGSYTGIRINIATFKALAYANKKPVVGVSTLEVISLENTRNADIIVPMIDARNKRAFSCLYRHGDRLVDEGNYSFEQILDFTTKYASEGSINKVFFCGDASLGFSEFFGIISSDKCYNNISDMAEFVDCDPKASLCALIAMNKMVNETKEGSIIDNNLGSPFSLKASYVSLSSAEQKAKMKA